MKIGNFGDPLDEELLHDTEKKKRAAAAKRQRENRNEELQEETGDQFAEE